MADRVTIISSCENREGQPGLKNYEPMSKRLVYSIRTNGGRYSECPIVMTYCEGAEPSSETKDWLENRGCSLRKIESFFPNNPVGNKTTAVGVPFGSQYGLWMDSDMYVLDSELFEGLIDRNVDIAAAGSAYGHHRWAALGDAEVWSQLYALAEVAPPGKFFRSGLDGEKVHVYFNSALVLFRNQANFPETWREMALKVLFSGIANVEMNFSQTSLTLSALKLFQDYEQLPQTYNAYFALEGDDALSKAILHYQDNVIDFDPKVRWDV